MKTKNHGRSIGRRIRERGIALVFAVFAIAALLVAITGALVTSSANTKSAWNYKAASQAHFVAESAISHALQTINAIGCINYKNEISDQWSTLFGTSAKTFTPLSGYSYTVTNSAGATPASTGVLVATATQVDASNNVLATNTVVANIIRDSNPSTAPGAIYLADDAATDATFTGNSFTVDGNDHTLAGGAGTGISIPGISTRNATNTAEAISSLSSGQRDNVQGYGYNGSSSPITPSITTSPSAPTVTEINRMISDMSTTNCSCTTVNNSCGCTYGDAYSTPPVCKVTSFGTGNVQIKNNGNVDGCGVMIVNGNLDIQGNVTFRGLIIVKGTMSISGSALVYGSVWTEGVNMSVGGNGQIYYSSQAMQLANSVFPTGTIAAPMKIYSMADCAELGSGVGGCP